MAITRDLRFAARQLSKTPGFTLTIVLTLAIGIGATTAVFSLVEGILLRPLPYYDSHRLVLLGDHLQEGPNISITPREVSLYSNATTAFSSMGGYTGNSYELSGGDNPEIIQGARVSASTFPTLGVQPLIGRTFSAQEENSSQPLTVISYSLWTNRFHRDPHVIGSPITLDRKTYTIIGVMPRSFEFPVFAGRLNQVQLWVPLSLTPTELSDANAGFWGFQMVARLKDNVTLAQAAADTNRVAQQVVKTFPSNMVAVTIRGDVQDLLENVVSGDTTTLLRTLFISVSVVLLIVCVNVAVMLLVRAIRRRREFAVRLALGARAGAVLRQSACEGLVLSLTGGLLGLGLAALSLPAIVRVLPDTLPRLTSISVDPRVAAFALLLAFATGILSSLAPAFAAVRTNLLESLKQSSRTGSEGASHNWLRSALVVSEIAVALMLLTASGALIRSYQKMLAVNPGFRPEHVLVAGYQLPESFYPNNSSVENFDRTVLDRLAAQPGTLDATLTVAVPATGGFPLGAYTVEGTESSWKLQFDEFTLVQPGYFRTLGIPLLDGRDFTIQDRENSPGVVIVNQSFAKRWWPGQSPIGKRLHIGNPKKGLPWATVIGLVGDVKRGSRDQPAGLQMYFPQFQPTLFPVDSTAPRSYPTGGFIAVRSALPPDQLTRNLRSVVASVDPRLALTGVQSLSSALVDIEAPRRFNTSLISLFAGGALLLALIGIYAVVAFAVSVRDQEIAIRMALGAQRPSVVRLVLGWGTRMAILGCVIGIAGSAALSRLLRSQLFEVSATDPWIYAASAALMIALAVCACGIPAFRAASADPVRSLRTP